MLVWLNACNEKAKNFVDICYLFLLKVLNADKMNTFLSVVGFVGFLVMCISATAKDVAPRLNQRSWRDFAACPCDLWPSKCDIDCCCDEVEYIQTEK